MYRMNFFISLCFFPVHITWLFNNDRMTDCGILDGTVAFDRETAEKGISAIATMKAPGYKLKGTAQRMVSYPFY